MEFSTLFLTGVTGISNEDYVAMEGKNCIYILSL